MTKTTREIEQEKHKDMFFIMILISIFISAFFTVLLGISLQNEISKLPQRVCYNESIIQTPKEFCKNVDKESELTSYYLDEDYVICTHTLRTNNISMSISSEYPLIDLLIEKEVCKIK